MTNPYSDVAAGDWFYHPVLCCHENGPLNGTAPGRFSPQGTVTRGMLVTVLGRLATVDESAYPGTMTGFYDVQYGDWFASFVDWAVGNDIADGISATAFSIQRQVVTNLKLIDEIVFIQDTPAMTYSGVDSDDDKAYDGTNSSTKPDAPSLRSSLMIRRSKQPHKRPSQPGRPFRQENL